MTAIQKIFALLTSLIILVLITYLVKKGKLREEFSWMWLLTGLLLLVLVVIFNFFGFAVGMAIAYLTFKGIEFHKGIIAFIFAAGCLALVPTVILGVIILLLAVISTSFINMILKELKPPKVSTKSPKKAVSNKPGKRRKKNK